MVCETDDEIIEYVIPMEGAHQIYLQMEEQEFAAHVVKPLFALPNHEVVSLEPRVEISALETIFLPGLQGHGEERYDMRRVLRRGPLVVGNGACTHSGDGNFLDDFAEFVEAPVGDGDADDLSAWLAEVMHEEPAQGDDPSASEQGSEDDEVLSVSGNSSAADEELVFPGEVDIDRCPIKAAYERLDFEDGPGNRILDSSTGECLAVIKHINFSMPNLAATCLAHDGCSLFMNVYNQSEEKWLRALEWIRQGQSCDGTTHKAAAEEIKNDFGLGKRSRKRTAES